MVGVWVCVDFAHPGVRQGARSAPLIPIETTSTHQRFRSTVPPPPRPLPRPRLSSAVVRAPLRPQPPLRAARAFPGLGVPGGALSLRLASGGSGHWAARGALSVLPTPEGAGKSCAKFLCAVDFIAKTP